MTTEVLNPQEFGIEEKQANEILGNLPQIKGEREVLEAQFNDIVKLDIEDIETSKKARELRLLIQKNRTQGINVWHKTTKDFFLKGGQFVDAIKRKENAVNERMETELETIEKYAEIQEQKRIEALRQSRIQDLEPYSDFVPMGIELGRLSQEEYDKVYMGAKLQHEAKIEADKKAEAERVKKEKLDSQERQRRFEIAPYTQFITENQDLRTMSDSKYSKLLKDLKDAKSAYEKEQEKIRLENERLKKEAEAKEKALELERKKAREEAEKLEAIRQAELKAEREKQAKLEAELKAKREAEAKAERERMQAEEKGRKEAEELAKAPIKEQLLQWVNMFEIPLPKVANETSLEIAKKFNAFKDWSIKEIEKL